MKHFILVGYVVVVLITFSGGAHGQGEDIREATGLPIQIGTPVIFGHVKIRGLAANESKPSVHVTLFLGGAQVERVRTNDRGYYYFLRTASDSASLVFEIDNAQVGRVTLNSSVGTSVRRDVEFDWLAAKSAKQGAPGVISVRAAYTRDPEAEKAFDRGVAAAKSRKPAEAIAIFDQIVSKDPKDFVAWTELGSVYFGDSKYAEAETAYKKAVELKPDFMIALMNLGKLHIAQKQPEKAITVLTKAALTDGTSANAFHYLGEAYLMSKLGSKAVIALNESIRLAPIEKADLHLRLAALYSAAGIKDRAANEYKLFLAKKPDHPDKTSLEKYIKENEK